MVQNVLRLSEKLFCLPLWNQLYSSALNLLSHFFVSFKPGVPDDVTSSKGGHTIDLDGVGRGTASNIAKVLLTTAGRRAKEHHHHHHH